MRRLLTAWAFLALALFAGWQVSAQNLDLGIWKTNTVAGGIALVRSSAVCLAACGTGVLTGNGTVTTNAGNLLVVGILYCFNGCGGGGTVAISSVSASNEGACTQVPNAFPPGASLKALTDIWYCKNLVGGSDTITITAASAAMDFPKAFFSEWSGASTTTPNDNIGNNLVSNSNSVSISTTASTASSGELVYSILDALGGATSTAGQTSLTGGGSGNTDQYQISGAPGTYTNTWSLSASVDFATSLGVFKQ